MEQSDSIAVGFPLAKVPVPSSTNIPSTVMEEEIGQTMRFIGVTSLKELKPDMLELLDGLVGKRLKSEEHYSSR